MLKLIKELSVSKKRADIININPSKNENDITKEQKNREFRLYYPNYYTIL